MGGGNGGDNGGGNGGDNGGDMCADNIATLQGEIDAMDQMRTDASAAQMPKINDFLDLMDPENTMDMQDDEYRDNVLIGQLSSVTQTDPQEPSIMLDAMCDQAILADYQTAANALAIVQTLDTLIESKISEICQSEEMKLNDFLPQAMSDVDNVATMNLQLLS